MTECCYCGGSLHKKILAYFDQPWGEKTYRFENVAALVCASCDEVFFEATVSQAMDTILQERPQPKRYDQIPVFDLQAEQV